MTDELPSSAAGETAAQPPPPPLPPPPPPPAAAPQGRGTTLAIIFVVVIYAGITGWKRLHPGLPPGLPAKSVQVSAAAAANPSGAQAPVNIAGDAAPLKLPDPVSLEEVEQVSGEFAEAIKNSEALIKQGQLDDPAAPILARLGPEDSAPPVRLLVAGNILFKLSPEDSYRLHMKALAKEPGSKLLSIEGAYEYQRGGKYAEACALWDKVLAAEPGRTVAKALRAHCRLAGGDVAGAVASWSGLSGEDHHNIETAVFEVFGPAHPLARRKQLLEEAAAAADRDAAVTRLILHDLTWETDWWNSRPNPRQAAVDLEKFNSKLAGNTSTQLQLLVRLYQAAAGEGGIPQGDLLFLRKLLSTFPELAPTPILRKLVAFADEQKLFTRKEMLGWLAPELEARLASAAGSGDDGILLSSLADGVDKALMERADARCAERYDQKNCVASTLISRQLSGGLTLGDPFLQKTLQAHPDWVFPHMTALQLAPEGSPESKDLLRRLILAEFHELEAGSPVHGPHNATGLLLFFKSLAEGNKPATADN
ncbi:MAG TPA: hypothetical protein PKI19_08985 [Elusimicrobiales bacterium]|nr:hypothetical protein [Elusimicrobiales bacterium]